MIRKKTCNNCDSKIKKSYNFCPGCGIQLRQPSEDWGMLGKKDNSQKKPELKMFGGGITGGIMNKMLGNAMKMLEKEMAKEMQNNPNNSNMPGFPGAKVKLMINGKEINPQKIPKKEEKKDNVKILPIDFSNENLEKWANLKKDEPQTSLKRIGDKIEYELDITGVKSIKDISIIKLENSIEVKAIAEEKAYQKVIPLNLPLKKYTLLKGKLTLELDAAM